MGPLQCAMQCHLDRLLEGIERTGGEEKSMNKEGRGNTENKKKKKEAGKVVILARRKDGMCMVVH